MRQLLPLFLTAAALSTGASAQVHYHADGQPWSQRADSGPDAVVPGWYYNLGVTGLRVELDGERPTQLVVRHVFEGSPADGAVEAGDRIVGAGGGVFVTPHQNGYGEEVFGAAGPIERFAAALDGALAKDGARLEVRLLRDGRLRDVALKLPKRAGTYGESFPVSCERTTRTLARLRAHLREEQQGDGSWGNPVHNTFAALALLSSGEKKDLDAVRKNARYHARTTRAVDDDSLINWRYMTAAIVLAEFYLATGEEWVLPELQEVHDFLKSSQYMDLAQLNPRVKESHPDAWPEEGTEQIGGWGHNVGFEGYGPIAMITGQGALAYALMKRCGLEVDEARHRAAYDFLARGTGSNGYLWYADEVAGDDSWADMGRTGASGIAHALSPFEGHAAAARQHAICIGEHPESFPDTHGSPLMGMGYAALAAWAHRPSFDRLMQANRWWFVLAECCDGTFAYQPNRDNAGYGSEARLAATAVTAFILAIPEGGLEMTGRGKR